MPPAKQQVPADPQPRGDVYIAIESFSCEIDGEQVTVSKGERVRAGHPLLTSQAGSFERIADQPVRFEWETR